MEQETYNQHIQDSAMMLVETLNADTNLDGWDAAAWLVTTSNGKVAALVSRDEQFAIFEPSDEHSAIPHLAAIISVFQDEDPADVPPSVVLRVIPQDDNIEATLLHTTAADDEFADPNFVAWLFNDADIPSTDEPPIAHEIVSAAITALTEAAETRRARGWNTIAVALVLDRTADNEMKVITSGWARRGETQRHFAMTESSSRPLIDLVDAYLAKNPATDAILLRITQDESESLHAEIEPCDAIESDLTRPEFGAYILGRIS
jgi:hypothetical protein